MVLGVDVQESMFWVLNLLQWDSQVHRYSLQQWYCPGIVSDCPVPSGRGMITSSSDEDAPVKTGGA